MNFSLLTLLGVIALASIAFFGVAYHSVWLCAAMHLGITLVLACIVLGIVWSSGAGRAYRIGFIVFSLTYLVSFCSFALPNGIFVTEELMKQFHQNTPGIMSVRSSFFHEAVSMIAGLIGGSVSQTMWRRKWQNSTLGSE